MAAPAYAPPTQDRLAEVNKNLLLLRDKLDDAERVSGQSRSGLIQMLRLDQPTANEQRHAMFNPMPSLLT